MEGIEIRPSVRNCRYMYGPLFGVWAGRIRKAGITRSRFLMKLLRLQKVLKAYFEDWNDLGIESLAYISFRGCLPSGTLTISLFYGPEGPLLRG